MSRLLRPSLWLASFALPATLFTAPVHADQLVYISLAQPCRLLDTRASTGGAGALTAAHGAYLFGTSTADIAAQNGNSAGCGIPAGIEAVSVNMNLLNASTSGNIATWSARVGPTAPNIGTAVYNPTVTSPAAGQVQYNTGYTSVPIGPPPPSRGDLVASDPGGFYLQVANGQVDMTINVVGYWLPMSWGENRSGYRAVSLGNHTTASGESSTAMGEGTAASGEGSTAAGTDTIASGYGSVAAGFLSKATGTDSFAMGANSTASGEISMAVGSLAMATGHSSVALGSYVNANNDYSVAIGRGTTADGENSTAIGSSVSTFGHKGSFIYGDASARSQVLNTADNQFVVAATGGTYFFSGCSITTCSTGVGLAPGSGSWFSLSDRNAKTAVQPLDPREVLKKVAALPLNTWQYKTQDAQYRHMGPMAQDFYAAFQLGESDKSIDTVDADGVALAAIQGLNALLAEKDAKTTAQLEEKDREIAALRTELTTRIAALESTATDLGEMKAQLAALRKFMPAEMTVALQQPR